MAIGFNNEFNSDATSSPSTVPGFDEHSKRRGYSDNNGKPKRTEKPAAKQKAKRYIPSDSIRTKCIIFAVALFALIVFSLCISEGYFYKLYSLGDVFSCYGAWFRLTITSATDPNAYTQAYYDVLNALPMYQDVINQVFQVLKYLICGILLSISGMLFQNTFRNPIAAPSMLGVSNGVSMALIVLVLQFGAMAKQMLFQYYLYAYIGGALVLILVLFGGKFISGKRDFNVVNMLLVGTIVSQMLGFILLYLQSAGMSADEWQAYYELQTAVGLDNVWTYITLIVGAVVTIVPIIAMRFRLNLASFSDDETRLLGVNPNNLRILALVCGSIMILTAQINAGQVAMASLVVPFIVRAVFGSEFRKQLLGNVFIGSILLLLCGDVFSLVNINNVPLDIGSVVTIIALPLFVWMLAIRQKSWE